MAKINVSMPDDVLRDLNRAAHEAGTSRSAFLSQAVLHYIEKKAEEQRMEERRMAAQRITEIAEKIGPWDGTAEVLKWRDRH